MSLSRFSLHTELLNDIPFVVGTVLIIEKVGVLFGEIKRRRVNIEGGR